MIAFDHWTAMHAWWVARRTERQAVGKAWAPKGTPTVGAQPEQPGMLPGAGAPESDRGQEAQHPPAPDTERHAVGKAWGPKTNKTKEEPCATENTGTTPTITSSFNDDTSTNLADGSTTTNEPTPSTSPHTTSSTTLSSTDPTRRDTLLARFEALAPADKKRFKARRIPKGDLDAIEGLLDKIEPRVAPTTHQGSGERSATLGSTPDEGVVISMPDVAVAAIRDRYNNLPEPAQQWTSELVKQANTAGVPFRLKDNVTTRRYEIYRGVLALAEWTEGNTLGNDDLIRSIVANIVGIYVASTPAGQALGALNADTATQFAQIATDLTQDRYTLRYEDNGRCRLEPVA